MKLPETYQELVIWLGIQFPVLAVVGYAVRWVVRRSDREQERRLADAHRCHQALLAEKERVISDRDRQIKAMESQIRSLKREIRGLQRGDRR